MQKLLILSVVVIPQILWVTSSQAGGFRGKPLGIHFGPEAYRKKPGEAQNATPPARVERRESQSRREELQRLDSGDHGELHPGGVVPADRGSYLPMAKTPRQKYFERAEETVNQWFIGEALFITDNNARFPYRDMSGTGPSADTF